VRPERSKQGTALPDSPSVLSFEVVGHPEPAGSKRAVPNSRDWQTRPGVTWKVLDDNPKSDGWKKTVAQAATLAMREHGLAPFDGPVWLSLTFRVHRPKGHYRAGGELSAEGKRHQFPTRKPDLLKQARGVEDAMTGIVYCDDAQIVHEHLYKIFTTGPEGITVKARSL